MRAAWLMAVALLAGAGFAGNATAQETTWDGFASLGAGNAWYSGFPSNGSGWTAQARGTGEFSLGDNWGSQFDIVGTHQTTSGTPPGAYTTIDFAGHAFYRVPGQWLLGPIAQFRTGTMVYGNNFVTNPTQYYLGGEAQAYMGMFSLYGQLAYQDANYYGSITATGWAARARARFFVNPEWFIEANALHSVLNGPQNFYDTTEDTVGVGTEFHVSGTPLGLFANYSYSSVSYGSSGKYNVSKVLAGLKWSFGGHSLWERETTGASLDPFPPAYQPPNPPA